MERTPSWEIKVNFFFFFILIPFAIASRPNCDEFLAGEPRVYLLLAKTPNFFFVTYKLRA